MFLIPPPGLIRKNVPPILPPVHIASESANNGSTDSTLTVVKPAGTVDGDLMVAFIMGSGVTVSSPPAGWTLQTLFNVTLDGTSTQGSVYTKFASSEPASYDWQMSGGTAVDLGSISTYRPAHATQLSDSASGALASNTNFHTANNITPLHDQTLIMAAYFLNRSSTSTSVVVIPPSGMTNRVNVNGAFFGRPDLQLAVYDEVLAVAGLYTGKQLESNPNTSSGGITIGIRALGTL